MSSIFETIDDKDDKKNSFFLFYKIDNYMTQHQNPVMNVKLKITRF
jgi:hypothetical protein